jgi:hypothetical protein
MTLPSCATDSWLVQTLNAMPACEARGLTFSGADMRLCQRTMPRALCRTSTYSCGESTGLHLLVGCAVSSRRGHTRALAFRARAAEGSKTPARWGGARAGKEGPPSLGVAGGSYVGHPVEMRGRVEPPSLLHAVTRATRAYSSSKALSTEPLVGIRRREHPPRSVICLLDASCECRWRVQHDGACVDLEANLVALLPLVKQTRRWKHLEDMVAQLVVGDQSAAGASNHCGIQPVPIVV